MGNKPYEIGGTSREILPFDLFFSFPPAERGPPDQHGGDPVPSPDPAEGGSHHQAVLFAFRGHQQDGHQNVQGGSRVSICFFIPQKNALRVCQYPEL